MEVTSEENGEVTSLGYIFTPEQMKYSESWEWLNTVLKKINSNVNHYIHNGIPETDKKYNCAVYVCKDFKTESRNRLIEIEDNTSQIDVTYRAVIEFIKWNNENNKAVPAA